LLPEKKLIPPPITHPLHPLQNPLLTNNSINKQQLTINRVNAVFFPADKSKKPGFFKKPGFWRAS
jgi:hypothetical protein